MTCFAFQDYEFSGETRVYTEGSYSKILSGPTTHNTCKSFAWPSYKCKCGLLEEEYLKVNKVIQDDKVNAAGMTHLQTILITASIALIFIGVVLVLIKYHLPKQKQMPNCLMRFSTQRDLAHSVPQPPRARVKKRPNVY